MGCFLLIVITLGFGSSSWWSDIEESFHEWWENVAEERQEKKQRQELERRLREEAEQERRERDRRLSPIRTKVKKFLSARAETDEFFITKSISLESFRNLKNEIKQQRKNAVDKLNDLKERLIRSGNDWQNSDRFKFLYRKANRLSDLYLRCVATMDEYYLDYISENKSVDEEDVAGIIREIERRLTEISTSRPQDYECDEYSYDEQLGFLKSGSLDKLFDCEALETFAHRADDEDKILECLIRIGDPIVWGRIAKSAESENLREIALWLISDRSLLDEIQAYAEKEERNELRLSVIDRISELEISPAKQR